MKRLSMDRFKSWLDLAKERTCELEIDQKNYRYNSDEHITYLKFTQGCMSVLSQAGEILKEPENKQKK